MRSLRPLLGLVLSFSVLGCPGPEGLPPGTDGGAADAAAMDGGGGTTCATNADCDDGLFCDGAERCMPGATDADGEGCVAGVVPCAAGETCEEDGDTCSARCVDADADGHGATSCGGDDCDDADANRYPGNVEVCDMTAHDEDCNTESFGFLDADSDGVAARVCCNVAAGGTLTCGTDCNDGDAMVSPRAGDGPPLYCDGVDNDCSGTSDEGCPCVEGETRECGTDPQLMRVGICRPGTQVCSGGAFTETCIGAVPPGAEICDSLDNDCDGTPDEGVLRTYYPDVDTDGYGTATGTPMMSCSAAAGYASNDADCDDARSSVSPSASEVCNAVDDNCSGTIDEGLLQTFRADVDGDGFGDPTGEMREACFAPTGFVALATDCDDGRPGVNPGAPEVCDTFDNDCDTRTDEGVARTYYRDGDGDGYGSTTTETTCTPSAGYTDRPGDCNDGSATVSPIAIERCDGTGTGVDDDCDGTRDEGCTCVDGTTQPCGPPTEIGICRRGTQLCSGGRWSTSCVGEVMPRTETCNGADDDCDGTADDGTTTSCYVDSDGDGRGTGTVRALCPATGGGCPTGYAAAAGDCNDGAASVGPTATETCNGIDDDCDGTADDGVSASPCYVDSDADGRGTGTPIQLCRDAARSAFGFCPVGYTNLPGDCNDASAAVRPGAAETCNGVDDDCSGAADNGAGMTCVRGATRTGSQSYGSCASVPGTFTCNTTCNGELFSPILTPESCNGLDDDCDGAADDTYTCVRSSTGLACTTGCGTPGSRNCSTSCTLGVCNAATESCNACDDDGDGSADEGLGCVFNSTMGCTTACTTPGTRRCRADCSGWDVCRAATETCNGCDDDGDGSDDEGFACSAGDAYPCMTACMVAATRTCTGTCTLPSTCYAAVESCNYCDDTGTLGIDDESYVATGSGYYGTPACSGTSMTIDGYCETVTADGLDYSAALITHPCCGVGNVGSAWVNQTFRMGFGTLYLQTAVIVTRTTSGIPSDGWAVIVSDNSGPNMGAGGASVGVPYGRTGFAVEWRYGSGGTDQDTITLRALTGGGTGAILATYNVPAGVYAMGRLDATTAGTVRQLLTIRFTADDPFTMANEQYLTVAPTSDPANVLIGAAVPISVDFAPGDTLRIGATAGTGVNPAATWIGFEDMSIVGTSPSWTLSRSRICPGT